MPKLKDLWNEYGYLTEKTDRGEVRISVTFKGQDGPQKFDPERFKRPCPTCGVQIGEHTPEEITECARKSHRGNSSES